MARLAATSRIAAHRSAIKLDFSISHDRNSVLILCIIIVAVFFLSRVVFQDVTSAEVSHCFRGGLSGLSFGGHFPLNHSLWLFRLRKAFLGRHFLSCVTMDILRMRCQI